MRWVVYALLAANLGLLTWNLYSRGGVAPAATRAPAQPANDVGRLALLSEIGGQELRRRAGAPAPPSPAAADAAPQAPAAARAPDAPAPDIDSGVMAGQGAAADGPPPPARTCLTLGPLADEAPLAAITGWLSERGAEVDVRTDERREVALYWVYFPPRASRDAAVEEVERLRAQGVDDVIVVPKGDMANAISLGVFSRTETRDRRLRELKGLGREPLVSPRYRTKQATWVDVAAQPGVLDEAAVAARWPEIQVTTSACARAEIAAAAGGSYNPDPETPPAAPRRFHFSGTEAR